MSVALRPFSNYFPSQYQLIYIQRWGVATLRPNFFLLCMHKHYTMTKNLKIGSVGRFFFFLRTVRELSFPIFFLTVSYRTWGQHSGGHLQSNTHILSAFLSHWIQMWCCKVLQPKSDIKKKKKKNPTLFFRILRSVGRGQQLTKFSIYWPNVHACDAQMSQLHRERNENKIIRLADMTFSDWNIPVH